MKTADLKMSILLSLLIANLYRLLSRINFFSPENFEGLLSRYPDFLTAVEV